MNSDFLGDILKAVVDGEEDDLILAMMAHLTVEKLQDLALACSNLKQLCEIAAADAPEEGERE